MIDEKMKSMIKQFKLAERGFAAAASYAQKSKAFEAASKMWAERERILKNFDSRLKDIIGRYLNNKVGPKTTKAEVRKIVRETGSKLAAELAGEISEKAIKETVKAASKVIMKRVALQAMRRTGVGAVNGSTRLYRDQSTFVSPAMTMQLHLIQIKMKP